MFIGKYNRFCFTVSLCVYQLHCGFSKCPRKVYNIEILYGFLYLKGKSRDGIQVELDDVYGEQSSSQPTIKRWFNEFKTGKTFV